MTHRIFIVEDHEIVREGYNMFLSLQDDLTVCGEAATAEDALERVGEARPDLLLVDISLPGMSGIDLVAHLRVRHPGMPALMITGHDNTVYRDRAMQAGAVGFVMKHDGPDVLLQAIYEVLNSTQHT